MSSLILGSIAGLATGLSTVAGALPALRTKPGYLNKWLNLDFAVGMMLAATAFNLILPAFKENKNSLSILFFLILGIFLIQVVNHILTHFDFIKNNSSAWTFVIAMMLHNFPEGLASGASFASESLTGGSMVLAAIMLQNIPEGLATVMTFKAIGLSTRWAFLGTIGTALMEVFGGVLGGSFAFTTQAGLPYVLAFAGGSMMSVTLTEIYHQIRLTGLAYLLRKEFVAGCLAVLTFNLLFI